MKLKCKNLMLKKTTIWCWRDSSQWQHWEWRWLKLKLG